MTGHLQALAARYDWLAARGEVPAYGYSRQKISYGLLIDRDGRLLDVLPLGDRSGKKPQPAHMLVPQASKRSGTEPKPFFLWDNAKFTLGAGHDPKSGKPVYFPGHFKRFRDFHESLLANICDEALDGLTAFLRNWSPEHTPTSITPEANLFFRLEGDDQFVHERSAAREIWLRHLDHGDAPEAECLVTGVRGSIERIHLPIKVPGSEIANLSIVAFNEDAFTSYGKTRGENAPVSKAAAFGYLTCLNHLLREGSRNFVRVGDATVVFWAEREEAETIARGFFDPPGPDEKGEAARVRAILEQIAKGRPIEQVDPRLDPATRFYVLGLAPNAARLSVRFWLETGFGDFARRFEAWWRDLRIEPEPWNGRLPALWRLLFELAPQGKAENVPAHLAGELTRAVLTGGRLPRALLAAAIMRQRADTDLKRDQIGRRAAIVKAVLARDLRLAGALLRENHLVSLDPDDPNPGYRLGRLFAVLENVQRGALGRNVNATIRDRYYGAASATPASVFPVLIRNANHHLASLRKAGNGGLAYTLEREMGRILDGLGSAFPRNLHLEDQGRFAIGYYQERFSRRSSLPAEETLPDSTDSSATGN